MTLRRALEMSKNLVTARLLDGGIADDPASSLDAICKLAIEAHVYPQCDAVLPVRARRPAGAADRSRRLLCGDRQRRQAADAACDRVDHPGRPRGLQSQGRSAAARRSIRPTVFQLRTMLQGVVARGTAARLSALVALRSAARPAPATISTTPGSPASPTTSRWWSGSATTTPRASARSARARPAPRSRCRSSSRSCARCGRSTRRRRRCAGRRRRRQSIWSRCRST